MQISLGKIPESIYNVHWDIVYGRGFCRAKKNVVLERRDAMIPEELRFEKETGNVFIKD